MKGLQWVQDNRDDFATTLQGICCMICDSYKDIGSPRQRFKTGLRLTSKCNSQTVTSNRDRAFTEGVNGVFWH